MKVYLQIPIFRTWLPRPNFEQIWMSLRVTWRQLIKLGEIFNMVFKYVHLYIITLFHQGSAIILLNPRPML